MSPRVTTSSQLAAPVFVRLTFAALLSIWSYFPGLNQLTVTHFVRSYLDIGVTILSSKASKNKLGIFPRDVEIQVSVVIFCGFYFYSEDVC